MCLTHMPMKAQKSPIIGKSQSVRMRFKKITTDHKIQVQMIQKYFNPQPSTSHKARDIPNINMYMPYIGGPAMDWDCK